MLSPFRLTPDAVLALESRTRGRWPAVARDAPPRRNAAVQTEKASDRPKPITVIPGEA
jgi:hypothetical protein